jgi:putative ATP-dependent endonuclease of the OLD family
MSPHRTRRCPIDSTVDLAVPTILTLEPRLHLSRVAITNFRNFLDLDVAPFPQRAVLVGENGVGKSNFLNALRLVLDPSLSDARRVLRPEDICESASKNFQQGLEVRVCVELQDFESDPVAKSVLDGCIVSTSPYTARLTYVFRPLVEIDKEEAAEAETRRLTPDDYEFVVFGGADERSDVRRVRRLVSLAILPALRDAVHDLGNVARSPLTELVEYLPPDTDAIREAAETIDKATTKLASDKNVARLAERIDKQITRMVGPQLDIEPTLGLTPSRPEQLIRSLRLFVDGVRSRDVSDTSTGTQMLFTWHFFWNGSSFGEMRRKLLKLFLPWRSRRPIFILACSATSSGICFAAESI